MWQTVAIIIITLCVFSSVSYCQNIEFAGKGGLFYFSSNDQEFKDNWSPYGYLIGGRISLVLKEPNVISLDIEDVKTDRLQRERIDYYGYVDIETQSQILSFYISYQRRSTMSKNFAPYLGGGFGISILSGNIIVEDISVDIDSKTDFAYKTFLGINLFQSLFVEGGYAYAGRNGNTGFFAFGGIKAKI